MSISDQDDKKVARTTTDEGKDFVDKRQHFKGSIRDFSILEICQIVIRGEKSGQLLIFRPNEEDLHAYIYFAKGRFVHAKYRFADHDVRRGDEVLAHIFQMKEGEFDFILDKSTSETSIRGDTMSILMNACHKADEASRVG